MLDRGKSTELGLVYLATAETDSHHAQIIAVDEEARGY
jgi:hypothetical protein